MWHLLLALTLTATQPATQPTVERPMDPWVFRCVLDGEPRRLVVALSDEYFLSYDLDRCVLDKVWKPAAQGGVELTGPVYDHRHGPQPRSRGEVIFESGDDLAWPVDAPPRYLGVTINGTKSVTLHWAITIDGEMLQVDETPSLNEHGVERNTDVDDVALPGPKHINNDTQ